MPDIIRECHEITSVLVRVMVDRARAFTSSGLHDEKMVSLGKLSAGLAHELNNPASAIERCAALLEDRVEQTEEATRALGAARLSDAQLTAVDALRASCMCKPVQGVRSPIEQAEREEEIADWLADHGCNIDAAETLAETPITVESLDNIARSIDGPALNAVLSWTAAGCSVRNLATEIQEAALRISGLVVAIKGFTHMDQAMVAEPLDLALSLSNTIAVLKSKARAKSVAVEITVEPNLPRVRGFIGELNQVWANLITMHWMPFRNRAASGSQPIASRKVSSSASWTMAVVFPRTFVSVSLNRSSLQSRWDKEQGLDWTSYDASSGTTKVKSLSNQNPDGRNFAWSCRSPKRKLTQERNEQARSACRGR
jgi:light-regulated signal transduction histidine kinase (bacteriophytochrome)